MVVERAGPMAEVDQERPGALCRAMRVWALGRLAPRLDREITDTGRDTRVGVASGQMSRGFRWRKTGRGPCSPDKAGTAGTGS
jgi:hypothetical protein